MSQNFWYYLLTNLVDFIVQRFLPGFPTHEYWGLPTIVSGYAGVMFVVTMAYIGQFIRLDVPLALLIIVGTIKWVRANMGLIVNILKFFMGF